MEPKQFDKRWPDIHSDKVRRAIRCIPADVAVAMPDEWLRTTVRQIAAAIDEVADEIHAMYAKRKADAMRKGGE